VPLEDVPLTMHTRPKSHEVASVASVQVPPASTLPAGSQSVYSAGLDVVLAAYPHARPSGQPLAPALVTGLHGTEQIFCTGGPVIVSTQ
jgi:hypothetical protein